MSQRLTHAVVRDKVSEDSGNNAEDHIIGYHPGQALIVRLDDVYIMIIISKKNNTLHC